MGIRFSTFWLSVMMPMSDWGGEFPLGNDGHALPFLATRTMFEQAFRNIDDALRKEAGCTTELDYTEQTSWLLFLKYLAGLEQDRAMEAEREGKRFDYLRAKPGRTTANDNKLQERTVYGKETKTGG